MVVFQALTRSQWQGSARIAIATLITGAIVFRWAAGSSVDIWYALYGVARSNLANEELSIRVGRERLLGTAFGGVIAALLLLVGNPWLWVGLAYLLVELLGSQLGLSRGSRTNAMVAAVMVLMVPNNSAEGFNYVLYRTLWHGLGLGIGMAVEHLFWPSNANQRLRQSEQRLIAFLKDLFLNPNPSGDAQQSRQLVQLYRGVRELQTTLVTTARSQGPLDHAVVHGAALLRQSNASPGPLEQQCQQLDREALGAHLAVLEAKPQP
ncbi:MAG: hypothetical protein ACOYLI_03850 [Synechococcus lacustris]